MVERDRFTRTHQRSAISGLFILAKRCLNDKGQYKVVRNAKLRENEFYDRIQK